MHRHAMNPPKGCKDMSFYFEKLVRANFRFGRM